MPSLAGYRELLANRRFVLYQASAFSANVGYSVYAISVPWLALELTGSLAVVGLVVFVELAGYSVVFLVAPWVDRARDKRTVFVAAYPVQAALAAVAGLGIARGAIGPGILLVLIAGLSVMWDLPWVAFNIVPRLLVRPDQLFRAEGFGSILSGATQVGGFSVGGVLVVLVGPSGGMFLYAGLLLAAAAIAAVVPLPAPVADGSASYRHRFRDGWRLFAPSSGGPLGQLAAVETVRGFFYAAPYLLITAEVVRAFDVSRTAYGTLFVVWVLGGVAAGLVLGELNPRHRVGALLVAAAAVQAVLFVVAVTLAGNLWVAGPIWFCIGAGGSAYLSGKYVYLRGAFPAEIVGRISSNLFVFTGVAGAIGSVVLGVVASTQTLDVLGYVGAVGMAATSALILAFPQLRRAAF